MIGVLILIEYFLEHSIKIGVIINNKNPLIYLDGNSLKCSANSN